ncbi:MAG: hypothetical protein P8R42_29435 [Candidatus Binatia bacterium]|nr:hypothetical protein [Candidatus Binatia bacterium]
MNILSKALATLATIATAATPAAAARSDVFFDGERVSAVAFETPLRDLLAALAAETGLQVRFTTDAGDEAVDVEIFELTVNEALGRILAHRGYSVVGSQIWISSPVAGFQAETTVVTGGAHAAYVAELGRQAFGVSGRGRLAATAELVRERSAAAIDALQDVLETERSSQIRASALCGLERSGNLSIDSLAELARDQEGGMLRRKAIQLLARHGAGSELAQSTLIDLADTAENPMIRLTARTALRTLERAAA